MGGKKGKRVGQESTPIDFKTRGSESINETGQGGLSQEKKKKKHLKCVDAHKGYSGTQTQIRREFRKEDRTVLKGKKGSLGVMICYIKLGHPEYEEHRRREGERRCLRGKKQKL